MANPTLPTITEEESEALHDTIDSRTGTRFIRHGVGKNDKPPVKTKLTERENWINALLAGMVQGLVVRTGIALQIGVFAALYRIGTTSYSFAGSAGTALGASDTHYIYLDADETLKTNTTGFPADCYRLAVVITDATDITEIQDRRWENADQGGTNLWYNVPAGGEIDFNDFGIADLLGIKWTEATELTVNSHAINPTGFLHRLDTEGDAASDELWDILPSSDGNRPWLLLRAENPARVVTIKDGVGNIVLLDGDYVLDDANKQIVLIQNDNFEYVEVCRNRNTMALLTETLDADGNNLINVGRVNLSLVDLVIAADAITLPAKGGSWIRLDTEALSATDDLTTINGGNEGDVIRIFPLAPASRVPTIKMGGNILIPNLYSPQYELASGGYWWEAVKLGNYWFEQSRSRYSMEDFVQTSRSLPYPITFSIIGALAAGSQEEWHYHCPYEMVIVNATGYADTAPSGGSCIVDILDDGASIFANDGERMVIADGTHQATSATKNHVIAAGSIVSCEIKNTGGSPNGAADLTVSVHAMIAPQSEP